MYNITSYTGEPSNSTDLDRRLLYLVEKQLKYTQVNIQIEGSKPMRTIMREDVFNLIMDWGLLYQDRYYRCRIMDGITSTYIFEERNILSLLPKLHY